MRPVGRREMGQTDVLDGPGAWGVGATLDGSMDSRPWTRGTDTDPQLRLQPAEWRPEMSHTAWGLPARKSMTLTKNSHVKERSRNTQELPEPPGRESNLGGLIGSRSPVGSAATGGLCSGL